MGAAECLAPVVAQRDHLRLHAHPSQISLESARNVCLAARGQADGDDEDLACMEEETRVGGVERRCHATA